MSPIRCFASIRLSTSNRNSPETDISEYIEWLAAVGESSRTSWEAKVPDLRGRTFPLDEDTLVGFEDLPVPWHVRLRVRITSNRDDGSGPIELLSSKLDQPKPSQYAAGALALTTTGFVNGVAHCAGVFSPVGQVNFEADSMGAQNGARW